MTHKLRYVSIILTTLVIFLGGYFIKSSVYPQYFDIRWQEEVELHDGRKIVVNVANTYERRGMSFTRYTENNITFRQKSLSFERRPGQTYTFRTRMPLAYIGEFDGEWYVVIAGQGPFGNYPEEMPTHWGGNFNTLLQRLAVLRGDTFTPIPWTLAPSQLTKMNLMDSVFFTEFLDWDGKILTLEQKNAFDAANPTPYRQEITRPIGFKKPPVDTK